jgi:hypothetical protein
MQSLIGVSARLLYVQRGATSRIAGGGQGDRRFKVDNAGAPSKHRARLCTATAAANQDGWPALTDVTLPRL